MVIGSRGTSGGSGVDLVQATFSALSNDLEGNYNACWYDGEFHSEYVSLYFDFDSMSGVWYPKDMEVAKNSIVCVYLYSMGINNPKEDDFEISGNAQILRLGKISSSDFLACFLIKGNCEIKFS